jgi:hypothetical protein
MANAAASSSAFSRMSPPCSTTCSCWHHKVCPAAPHM